MALQNLNIKVDHLFSCDISAAAKKTIEANYPPKIFYDNLMERDNSCASVPKVDVYVAGFPCQPFSAAGKQQGFSDEAGRGTIFFGVREYIKKKQPKVFILENVSGLLRLKGGEYFRDIMKSLEALKTYNIYWQMLNTKEHGVAQNRKRVYLVGIDKKVDKGTFTFPEPLPPTSLSELLDPKKGKVDWSMLPPKSSGTAHRNTILALKKLFAAGRDPFNEPWVVDVDSSTDRMKFMYDISPCLTCSRAAGHWITNRGRRMNVREQSRCQAVKYEEMTVAVTERQLGFQLGNAMSVNCLERIFVRLLPAAGLAKASALKDVWEARAQTKRKRTVTNAEMKLKMAKAGAKASTRLTRTQQSWAADAKVAAKRKVPALISRAELKRKRSQ